MYSPRNIVALQSILAMLLIGLDIACHGILLAKRDYSYIAQSYSLTLLLLLGYLYCSSAMGWGLAGVWWGIVFFFFMRTFQSAARLWAIEVGWVAVSSATASLEE